MISAMILEDEFAVLLRQCCETKCLSQGKLIHERIRSAGLVGDTYLGNLLLRMYGQCGSLENARDVFDQMPRRNVFSGNILITAYAQKGCLDEARWVFDQMAEKNTVSWNSMISACTHNRRPEEALLVFHRMVLEGMRPNAVTLVTTVDACSSVSQMPSLGIVLHEVSVQSGLLESIKVGNAVMNMYGKHARLIEARKVFGAMEERDIVSWNTLLAAYALNGHLLEAEKLFSEIELDRNLVSWNTMISGYAQNGREGCALVTFAFMDLEGVQPNGPSFVSVFDACAGIQALAQGRVIHSLLLQCCGDESIAHVETGNSLINMYARCKCSLEAEKAFAQMTITNVISWSSLIAAHVSGSDFNSAFRAFHQMNLEGVPPNDVTFVAVLNACSHQGTVKQGWEFFVSLHHDHGLMACVDHVVCIVDLFGRAGLIDEAVKLVKDSKFFNCSVPWMAILSAWRSNNKGVVDSKVAKEALSLNGGKASPYILISNSLYDAAK